MAFPSTVQLAATNALISAGFVLLGAALWRRYDEIGSRTLGLFATLWGVNFVLASLELFIVASYGVTASTELDTLSVPPDVELVLFGIAPLTELFTVIAIFTWLWFVLRYVTRLDRQEEIAIGTLAATLILITAVNTLVGTLTTFGYLQIPIGLENSIHLLAGIIEIVGTGVAVGAGIALLFRTAQRHPLLEGGAVPALSAAILLPYLVRYTFRLGLITEFRTIGLLWFGSLSVGLVGLWVAVTRYDVFDQLPASQTVGRDTALDSLETAIVLLDRRGSVSDLNPAARTLFDSPDSGVIGEPLGALLPGTADPDALGRPGRTTFAFPHSDRILEAETAVTTDDRGRELGRAIVFNDITDERRRQQRIQVLNRVLRHNLRTDVNVASGYLEAIVDGDGDADEYAGRVRSKLGELVDIGSKAREIEAVLAAEPLLDSPVSLAGTVRDAVGAVTPADSAVSITVDVPADVEVTVNPRILGSVVEELVENALEHTDADVTVAFDPATHRLTVTDAGPGISEYEIEVFESGEETALRHGSGLGLWLVKWGLDRVGGRIDFEVDRGTRAVVTLPENTVRRRDDAGATGQDPVSTEPPA